MKKILGEKQNSFFHDYKIIVAAGAQAGIGLKALKNTEKKIYAIIKSSNPEIIDSINSTGKLDDEIEKKLTSVIKKFKEQSK